MSGNGSLKHSVSAISVVVEAEAGKVFVFYSKQLSQLCVVPGVLGQQQVVDTEFEVRSVKQDRARAIKGLAYQEMLGQPLGCQSQSVAH